MAFELLSTTIDCPKTRKCTISPTKAVKSNACEMDQDAYSPYSADRSRKVIHGLEVGESNTFPRIGRGLGPGGNGIRRVRTFHRTADQKNAHILKTSVATATVSKSVVGSPIADVAARGGT